MGKRAQRNARMIDGSSSEAPRKPAVLSGGSWVSTIVVLAVLGILGYLNLRQNRVLRETVDYRLDQLDSRLLELSKKVEAVGTRAAVPAQRGPDPNRVYSVKTAGAPVKGPLSAPVTIVEFSDFQ